MAERAWPTQPFYIQSFLDGSNYAMTFWQRPVDGTIEDNVGLRPLTPGVWHLWKALPDPRGGAFLQHVGTGYFLTRVGNQLRLGPMEYNNRHQLWCADELEWPGRVGIRAQSDWGVSWDVYYNDVNGRVGMWGTNNNRWNQQWILIPEVGGLEVTKVTYDLAAAIKNFNEPPSRMAALVVRNPSNSIVMEVSKKLERSVTKSRTISLEITDARTLTYSQTFSVSASLGAWEASSEFKFEQSYTKSTTLSNSTTESETMTEEVTVSGAIPPGKTWSFQLAVYYAKFRIPFTAQMRFRSSLPGSPTEDLTVSGWYDGVNGVKTEVEVNENA
jgi:hypothetical protein